MDTKRKLHNFAWDSKEHKVKIAKGLVPAELRRFKVVFQFDIKELPTTEEVELSVRRVVYGQITNDPTIQDAEKDDADIHGVSDVSQRNTGP